MAVNYYKKDKKTGKWVVDEALSASSKNTAASKASRAAAASGADPIREWEDYVKNRAATLAAQDIPNAFTAAKVADTYTADNIYKMGGASALRSDRGLYGYRQLNQQLPQYMAGLQSGTPYGMTEEDEFALKTAASDVYKHTKAQNTLLTARTGGLSSIDMTGMSKAQQEELQRGDTLARRDAIYEKLKANPDQEYYEHNYGEIFGDMSEREYLDNFTAYLRDQQRKEQAGAEAKYWIDQAKAVEGSVQGDGKYVQGKAYWRSLDRAALDSWQPTFFVDGEELTREEYIQKAEQSYINDYLGALQRGDMATVNELIDVGTSFPEIGSKFNVDALSYASPDQVKTAINLYNAGDMAGLSDYLGKIDYDLSSEMAETQEENAAAWASESVGNQALGVLASYPMNFVGGFSGAADTMVDLLEGTDWYNPIGGEYAHSQGSASRRLFGTSDIYRGSMGQTIESIPVIGPVANTAFQGITSLGDSVLATLAGPMAMYTTMFGQEGGRILHEQQDAGNENAGIQALGAGVISALAEKVGVDSLFKGSIKKAILGNAGEEGLTAVAHILWDKVVNGKNSAYNALVDQYRVYGYGDKAEFKAQLDNAANVLQEAAAGAFGGFAGGIPDAINMRNEGKNLTNNGGEEALASLAESVPVDDKAKDIARRLREEMAERRKGDKAETETDDAASITAEDAEAEARESEMADRGSAEASELDKGDKTDEGIDDTVDVTKEDAEAEARETEMAARDSAERMDDSKGEKADEAIDDTADVTKEDAEAAVRAEEMTERDRAERADEGKTVEETDPASVTEEDAEAAARTARDRGESADMTRGGRAEAEIDDTASVTEEDVRALTEAEAREWLNDEESWAESDEATDTDAAAKDVAEEPSTINADAIASDYADTAAKRGEIEAREAERQQRRNERKAARDKRRKAVTKAEKGYLYRQILANLDKGAQQIVKDNFTRDMRREIEAVGYSGNAKEAAKVLSDFINGEVTPRALELLGGFESLRNIALSYTGKIIMRNNLYKQAGELSERAQKGYVKPETTTPEEDADKAKGPSEGDAEADSDIDYEDMDADGEDAGGVIEVSDTPESTYDGKAVTIESVKIISKMRGEYEYRVTVKDADGNTYEVSAADISFGSNDGKMAEIMSKALELKTDVNTAISMFNPETQDVSEYIAAWNAASEYGFDGRSIDVVKGDASINSVLTPEQIEAAYNSDRDFRRSYPGGGGRFSAYRMRRYASVPTGKVDTSVIDMRDLSNNQRAAIRAMSSFAKAVGFNLRFVESKSDAKGRYRTENGSWDPSTLTLTLDIHAGSNKAADGNYAMMHTAGHELTHYIRQFADSDLWNDFQEFVIGHLSKKGDAFDLDGAIKKHMDRGLSRNSALEEVIADASGEALMNITEADIQSIAETNPTLLNKIKNFFRKWISNLKKRIADAYAGTEAKTEEAKQMQDVVDELSKRWNELFVNATKNKAVASETTVEGVEDALRIDEDTQDAIDSDMPVTADTEIKNSLRMDEEFGEDAKRVNQTNKYVSAKTLAQAIADRAVIRSIFTDPKNLDLLKLPPDIEGDTFVSDSSYGGTEENTTVCIRSMAAQALMDLISQNLGRPLTVQDTLLISQEIAGLTDRPECYYCYVATDRRAYRDFLGQYLEQRNDVIKKYKAGADRKALYDEFLNGRKPTSNMKARFDMWLDAVDNGTEMIDGNDLASLENLFGEVDSLRSEILAAAAEVSGVDASKLNIVNGKVRYAKSGKQITATTLKALMKSNPGMADRINRYNQLTDATAYAQSASWAKKMKGYAAYNGHILKWSQKRISDLNKHYGLRMYSFSDFSPAFILENMQMVTDAAVRGLNMLGYTKEMPFAEIFAPSGMNINISTFAYEQGDEIREDYKQGASWERAKALREKHPNVGIVMVATSDKILEWALQQDWVDVVIPYHLVRTGTDVAEYFGYKNYTGVSADGKGLTFADKNKGKSKKDRVTSVSPVEHRNDLISYVDALQRYGLTPRFASWLKGLDEYLAGEISPKQFREMNPNYMKLVNETRRSYADTAPVQPVFDVKAAQEAIQQMIREGGYYTPVGGSMEAQFEIAGNVADKIRSREATFYDDGKKYSLRDTDEDDIRYQERDYSVLSDRELLVEALETDLKPVEREHLERYAGRVSDLDKQQRDLEELHTQIAQMRAEGKTATNSSELLTALDKAKKLRGKIDRADAQLKEIESADMIREVVRRTREETRRKTAAQVRARADERMRKEVERVRGIGERKVKRVKDSYDTDKYRKQILADVRRIHGWIASPTSKGYAPEFMREPLAELLDSIDFTSARGLKGGDPTKADTKFTEALDKMREAVTRLNKAYAGLDEGAEAFSGYIDLPADFADEFDALVSKIKGVISIRSGISDAPFFKMSAEQLHEMAKMFRILKSSIMNVNRLVANNRYDSAKAASTATVEDMDEMSARKKTSKVLETLNSTFNWKNMTPYNVFRRLGRGGRAIFEGLQDGWDKMAQNTRKVKEYAEETFKGEEKKSWSGEISEVKLDSGDVIKMTTAQKMSLYCHSKREQSMGHLMGGGIRIADIDGKRGTTISQTEDYILTEGDIARIIGSLTARQKEVADALQAFMNDVCAMWGNEISMKRFGFEQMTEKFYFPIETDANNRSKIDESKDGSNSMFRLLNMSSLKPLTPNANNAIVIKDIFNVFNDHASDMAKYNALALPILDFIKWYNFVEKTDVLDADGKPTGKHKTRSVQKSLERTYGKDAKSYLLSFIKDLNAEQDGGRDDNIINKWMSRAKAASVGANLRVYMQQITSLPRAAFVIDEKYLAIGIANIRKGNKLRDDVGILQWKDMGFYSTDFSRSMRSMISRDYSFLDKVRNWQMVPAGWGDQVVSSIICGAVAAEMKDKHPTLTVGTDVYKTMFNRRVREIIYRTQVVDSTMTRSQLMRSKGAMPMFTSFMSEPTLTVNMLNEAIQDALIRKRGGKLDENDFKPGTKAYRAAKAFLMAGVFNALIAAVVDAFRDDDEYEKYKEKYLDALKNNAIDNFNVFSMIPIIAEASDALEAMIKGNEYNPSTLSVQAIKSVVDSVNAIKEYTNGKRTLTNVIYNNLKAASYNSGIGMYNATRDLVAIYNTAIANGTTLPKLQSYTDNKDKAAMAMYEAAKKGDEELFARYAARAELHGITAEDLDGKYTKLISEDYVAGKISEDEADRMLKMYGGKTEYQTQTLISKLDYEAETGLEYSKIEANYVSGVIDKASAKKALITYGEKDVKKADAEILTWDYQKATGRKYSSIETEYIRGEISRSEIKRAMVKYGGKNDGEAEKAILHLDYQKKTGRPWSNLKSDYINKRYSASQVKKYLMTYDAKTEEEAQDTIEDYDFQVYTGKTTSAPKYWRLAYTYEIGGDYEAYADEIFARIMATGKSWKQVRSSIASSIASYYKKDYLAIKGTAAGDRMLEEILDVYEAIGYDRASERKYIAENWTDD